MIIISVMSKHDTW